MSELKDLPSQAPLMQMSTGFWVSNTLSAALELGLFDALSSGGLERDQIARKLGLETRPVRMLLAACAALGLLEKDGARYRNTAMAQTYLVRGGPYYFGGWVEMLQKRLYFLWYELADALKKNQPKAAEKGSTIFNYFESNPETARLFAGAMHSLSSSSAAALARAVDFTRHRRMLDVGGGSGAFCIELARACPGLTCTLFDLPTMAKVARGFADQSGLGGRIQFVEGDFFRDTLPEGHDLIVLSMIMHDWTPEENLQTLRKCHRALAPGGRLVIAELMMDDDETGPLPSALMSLNMMIELEGMNYTWGEYEEWLREVGFGKLQRVPVEGGGANGVILAEKS